MLPITLWRHRLPSVARGVSIQRLNTKRSLDRVASTVSRGYSSGALLFCLVLAVASATACTADAEPPCPEGADSWVKYEVFMGRGNADGEIVDDAAWDAFLADTATPRFPDGLTVPRHLTVSGAIRKGVVKRERSKVLVVTSPRRAQEPLSLIHEVSGRVQSAASTKTRCYKPPAPHVSRSR